MTGSVGRVFYLLRRSLIPATILTIAPAFAASVDIKTTYDISPNWARAKTVYKKAPADLDDRFSDSLWETFASRLRSMPTVTDLQTGETSSTKNDQGSSVNYVEVKKSFPVFVQLSLPKSATMLMKVEQTNHICKDPQSVDPTPGAQNPPAPCVLNSMLEIKGPISVYGTFQTESNLNMSDLMRDKQRIVINVTRSDDKADLTLDSALMVDSMAFEKSLLKFFDVFDVGSVSKKAEDLTRQSMFLGVARIIRQTNERMLDL